MKLYGSFTSPFVRTVRIAATELGLLDEIEFVETVVLPGKPNRAYGKDVNPLRRVPALETDAGEAIVDSRVIIEYLNVRAAGAFVPAAGEARVSCLNRHAIVAGATEALVLAMYEARVRPAEFQWPEWMDDQVDKADKTLDWVEENLDGFAKSFDLSSAALVCLTGYAAFRFPDHQWLERRPKLAAYLDELAARPSVSETAPPTA